MNNNRIISELNLRPFGNKGWMHSESTPCSFGCERHDKFGILFTNEGGLVKCMRCGESTSLFNYLLKINRNDLIEGFSAPVVNQLRTLEKEELKVEDKEQKKVTLPDGFRRVYFDDYLDGRGFISTDYKKYHIGVSDERRLRHHIVFPIYQNGELKSWLARSRMTKDWHKQNIRDFKDKNASLVLRYYNSEGTEFSEIVGNLDNIVHENCILVEGLFDEQNVSKMISELKLEESCGFTFGKSLSIEQVNLLVEKGVKNLTLMYDPDALKEIEKYVMKYANRFENIYGIALKGDKDPGDLITDEFLQYYNNNKKRGLEFYQTNLKKIF